MANELKARITVDTTMLARGLQASTNTVRKWASDVRNQVMGAFSGAAIVAAVRSTADQIGDIGDSATRLNRTVEEVQLLTRVARLAGVELGKVETILANISESQIDALQGNEKKKQLFNKMGITSTDIQSRSEFDILKKMATNLSGKSGAEIRALTSDIIGKKNVGTFANMSGDLAEFDRNLKSNIANKSVLSAEQVYKLKIETDALYVSFDSLKTQILSSVLPALLAFTNYLNKGVAGTKLLFDLVFKRNSEASWTEYINKLNELDKVKSTIDERIKFERESSKIGPGLDFERKKNKYNYRFPVDESVFNKSAKSARSFELYNSTGGFFGADLRMIGDINKSITDSLKEQIKIQREMLQELKKKSLNEGLLDTTMAIPLYI